jgi:hypothetical protein
MRNAAGEGDSLPQSCTAELDERTDHAITNQLESCNSDAESRYMVGILQKRKDNSNT